MLKNLKNVKNLKYIFFSLFLSLFLSSTLSFADQDHQEDRQIAQSYLEQSKTSAFPQNIEFRLLAADVYIQSGLTLQAKEILNSLPVNSLPDNLRILQQLLLAELALKNQHPDQALERTSFLQNQALSPAYQVRVGLIRAKAYHALSAPIESQSKQIALLVPLTGPKNTLGQAIKDGFLSGYQYANPITRPNVKIYDTNTYQDMVALYQKALEEGADLIVGPLFKEEVRQFSSQPDGFFSVPLLALNQANMNALPSRLFQFALSPEQEASIIAERLHQRNKHTPMLIVPDNDWGKRFAQTFEEKLDTLQGTLVHTLYIKPQQNLGRAISQHFELDSSQARFRQVSNRLGTKIEVQPRRRQDLDSLVLTLSPPQARQIKPLLDFYYAHDLPIFGSSNIYSGTPNPKKDMDLNGIQFCDMPWFLVPDQTDYAQRGGKIQALPEQQARLFAMGVDAFDLSMQLKQLSANPGASYAGMTGKLSIEDNHIISRQLVWAEFKNGVPIRSHAQLKTPN